MAKWLLVLLALAVAVGLSTSGVLASARDAPDAVKRIVHGEGDVKSSAVQSGEQLSQFEFNNLGAGTSVARLRELVGDPASHNTVKVEGIRVECLYYGVARASGAYQFCFQNGRLRTKARFNDPVSRTVRTP